MTVRALDLARSLMFVPGQRGRMVEKALGLVELDVALLDLEDGVPLAEKAAARTLLAKAIGAATSARPLRFVRVNAVASDHFAADIASVVRPGLDGVCLAKVEGAEDVATADRLVAEHERAADLPPGGLPFVASIESARALLAAGTIAGASRRIVGLMFGAEDFANDLGLPPDRQGEARDLLHARSTVVVAAAAARVLAFDGIWPDIADADGLRRDSLQGRRLGFSGKTCVHPAQIPTINEIFTPTQADVDRARRVVEAFEEAERRGEAALAFDGHLVDRPIVERARRVLRARELAHR